MRLLYICSDFGIKPNGVKGASVHLRAITRGLADLGHDIRVLSPHAGPDGGHPATPVLTAETRPTLAVVKAIRRWLAEHDLDEDAGNVFRPLAYNATIVQPALRALGDWRPDAVIERLSLYGQAGADIAAALNVPHILEVNAILTEEARTYRSLEFSNLAERIQERTLQRADGVIAVSDELARRIVELGVNPKHVHVVPNGYDPTMFQGLPSREQCASEFGVGDSFVVGFSGSLKPWHGVDVLLAAFDRFSARHPMSRLLIVGAGPMEMSLRESAKRVQRPETVVFTGALPHELVPRALRAMDVAVAPFRYQEGFYFSPIKLFEYMASGACVVASRLGQIRDIVEDGGDGLLCEPDSAEDLCAKLVRLEAAPDMRHRLAARAARRVHERFTWNHAACKTEDVVSAGILRTCSKIAVGTGTSHGITKVAS
ncbi:MAG: glycosyltransferase family 4 protein [Phycisphaerales bacterium]|nr:glycosyltransferase family 4 protein [Phycisphaerales bacterium]